MIQRPIPRCTQLRRDGSPCPSYATKDGLCDGITRRRSPSTRRTEPGSGEPSIPERGTHGIPIAHELERASRRSQSAERTEYR
jgi:hypothetical protein